MWSKSLVWSWTLVLSFCLNSDICYPSNNLCWLHEISGVLDNSIELVWVLIPKNLLNISNFSVWQKKGRKCPLHIDSEAMDSGFRYDRHMLATMGSVECELKFWYNIRWSKKLQKLIRVYLLSVFWTLWREGNRKAF